MQSKPDLTISIIQTDIVWENKSANLDRFDKYIYNINTTDLIVLPEMFTTGFSNRSSQLSESMDGISVQWMCNKAKEKDAVITGSLIIEENGKYYNRMIWAYPYGDVQYYDKKHLFSYAKENENYSSGNERKIIHVKEWNISPMVCYDLRFPVWSRRSTTDYDYHLLVYIASWPIARIQAWSALLKARAIENMSYVIGVNRIGTDGNKIEYCGDSEILDPLGTSIKKCDSYKEAVFTIELQKEDLIQTRQKLNFQNDADAFNFLN